MTRDRKRVCALHTNPLPVKKHTTIPTKKHSRVHRQCRVGRGLSGLVATTSHADGAVVEHSEGGRGIACQEKPPHHQQHALLEREREKEREKAEHPRGQNEQPEEKGSHGTLSGGVHLEHLRAPRTSWACVVILHGQLSSLAATHELVGELVVRIFCSQGLCCLGIEKGNTMLYSKCSFWCPRRLPV